MKIVLTIILNLFDISDVPSKTLLSTPSFIGKIFLKSLAFLLD